MNGNTSDARTRTWGLAYWQWACIALLFVESLIYSRSDLGHPAEFVAALVTDFWGVIFIVCFFAPWLIVWPFAGLTAAVFARVFWKLVLE